MDLSVRRGRARLILAGGLDTVAMIWLRMTIVLPHRYDNTAIEMS